MNQPTMKYGLICGLVFIIFGLIAIITGVQTSGNFMTGLLMWLVPFGATFYVIFLALKDERATSGTMSAGIGFKSGVKIAFVAALLLAVFNLLYTQVIDPSYMEGVIEAQRDNLEERGMSEEQIEQSMKMTSMFQNPALGAALTVIWYVMGGMVKGLIGGAVLKQGPEDAS